MSARAIRRMAAACGMLLLVAACGGSSAGSSGSASPSAGTVTNGGTLKLLGGCSRWNARSPGSWSAIPPPPTISAATTVAPDLASTLPTTANGGISADGKTYTFHLRSGAQWNTSPPRAVTAADVVRGLQRICNPASPSGGLSYYEDTIAGFTKFCNGFAKVNASSPTAMAST